MHRTVRGAALAVVGDSWTVTNTAPMPAFEAATPIDPAMLPALRSSLVNGTTDHPITPTPNLNLTLTLTPTPAPNPDPDPSPNPNP